MKASQSNSIRRAIQLLNEYAVTCDKKGVFTPKYAEKTKSIRDNIKDLRSIIEGEAYETLGNNQNT